MRRFLLFLAALIIVLGAMIGAVVVFRAPLIEMAAGHVLRNAGFDDVGVNVEAVDGEKIILSSLKARAGATTTVDMDYLEARFDWKTLLRSKRLDSIVIGPGTVMAKVDEQGRLQLPTAFAGDNAKQSGPSTFSLADIPIGVVTIRDLIAVVETPRGSAKSTLTGKFEPADGGEFDAVLSAPAAGLDDIGVSNLVGTGRLAIVGDGAATFAVALTGDIDIAGAAIEGLDATVDGDIANWTKVLETGDLFKTETTATVRLASVTMAPQNAAGSPLLDAVALDALKALPGGAISTISLSGAVRFEATPAAATISLPHGPFILTTDRGDRLTLSSIDPDQTPGSPTPTIDGDPLFDLSADGQRLAMQLDLSGPSQARFGVSAFSADGARWTLDVDGAVTEQTLAGVSLGPSSIKFGGEGDQSTFTGILDAKAVVKSASVGRMLVQDAETRLASSVSLSVSEGRLAIGSDGEGCIHFDKGRFRIVSEDLAASIWDADACAEGGPLLVANWADAPSARVRAEMKTKRGFFRLGQTLLTGAPPDILLDATYLPDEETSNVSALFSDGRVVFNEALVFSTIHGSMTAQLEGPALTADMTLDKTRIDQTGKNPLAAPVLVDGSGRLADDTLSFTYSAWSLGRSGQKGYELGKGRGVHVVDTGRGFAEYHADDLLFSVDGLQPVNLTPLAQGIIFDAEGGGAAAFRFDWDTDEVTSSGEIGFSDLSFGGPGLAVTKTGGVKGAIRLKSLLPAATEGEQRIDIGLVDLDALKLENGVVRFELPGDDTLKVVHAEFPWFGGTIGAYDSVSPLTGGAATTRLQAADVDLKQLLAFVNVEGLSGEGVIEGVLPLVVDDGIASIEGGVLKAVGPGVIRYTGAVSQAVSSQASVSEGGDTNLAFSALREISYETLSATIDGRLDGDLIFGINFEGTSVVQLDDPRIKEPVALPFIYKVTVKAPLLRLIEQINAINNIELTLEELAEQERRKTE